MVGGASRASELCSIEPSSGETERKREGERVSQRESRVPGLHFLEQGGEVAHIQGREGAMWPMALVHSRTMALLPTDPNSQGID